MISHTNRGVEMEYGKIEADSFNRRQYRVKSRIGILYFRTEAEALKVMSEHPQEFKPEQGSKNYNEKHTTN